MPSPKSLIARTWASGTFATWMSFAARSGSLLLVTPLVLTRFSKAEILLWFFFLTVASLQLMADFGFGPSFVRAVAYARAGRKRLEDPAEVGEGPQWELLANISRVLHRTYRNLSLSGLALAAVFGTWATAKPVGNLAWPTEGWIAWLVVLVCNTLVFRNNAYSVWLQGMNHVALLRRIETLFSLVTTLTVAIAIWLGGKFLVAVVAAQAAAVLASFGIRIIAQRLVPVTAAATPQAEAEASVFRFIWPAAWRSGVGVLMSSAIIQASGLVYAQFGEAGAVASYLFAMRIMQMLIQISMAPFYSKIPWFASLYGRGTRDELIPAARKAMAQCHWIFACGVVGVAVFMNPLLLMLHSKVQFVPSNLWMALGFAFMIERIGAMHIQFYSLSNHILWHVANGVSGTIYIALSILLLPHLQAFAFPVAMLIAYLSFYTWFAARLVYRHYAINGYEFETRSSATPLGLLLVAALFVTVRLH